MTKLNKMSQQTSFKHRKPHLNPIITEPPKTNFHLLIYLNSNLNPTITTFYSIKKTKENLNLHSTIKPIKSPKTNHIQKLKKKNLIHLQTSNKLLHLLCS